MNPKMRVRVLLSFLVACLLFAVAGCGGDQEAQKTGSDSRSLHAERLKSGLDQLREDETALRNDITHLRETLRTQQAQFGETLSRMEDSLDAIAQKRSRMQAGYVVLQDSEKADTPARPAREDDWHWSVKIVLILAVVMIFYLLYKQWTRDEELDDENVPVEEIVQENELGTVRYPGETAQTSGEDSEGTDIEAEKKPEGPRGE